MSRPGTATTDSHSQSMMQARQRHQDLCRVVHGAEKRPGRCSMITTDMDSRCWGELLFSHLLRADAGRRRSKFSSDEASTDAHPAGGLMHEGY